MRRIALSIAFLAVAVPACAEQGMPPETQIALAVQAAPESMREAARVQGYDARGNFTELRVGSNELICMAPNPEADGFEVSCHHAGLEPFFARGRELRVSGIDGQERTQARWSEFEAGTLPIPAGSTNYIMTGAGFDPVTHEVQGGFLRWVIYTPMATPESTGLPTQGSEGAPWLMFPGTPGSHIMIVPPRAGGD
jgi:hypothetical protein